MSIRQLFDFITDLSFGIEEQEMEDELEKVCFDDVSGKNVKAFAISISKQSIVEIAASRMHLLCRSKNDCSKNKGSI
jgi:hypothetical protein